MLRPTDCIADCGGLIRAGSGGERLSHLHKKILRNSAVALYHFGGVARKVALQNLKDAAWVLQGRVGDELAGILRFPAAIFSVSSAGGGVSGLLTFNRGCRIKPAFGIVLIFVGVPSREKSVEIFGVAEIFAQNRRSMGVGNYIFAEIFIVLENVAYERAKKDDVAASAQRNPDVSHGGGPRVARIDVNDLG